MVPVTCDPRSSRSDSSPFTASDNAFRNDPSSLLSRLAATGTHRVLRVVIVVLLLVRDVRDRNGLGGTIVTHQYHQDLIDPNIALVHCFLLNGAHRVTRHYFVLLIGGHQPSSASSATSCSSRLVLRLTTESSNRLSKKESTSSSSSGSRSDTFSSRSSLTASTVWAKARFFFAFLMTKYCPGWLSGLVNSSCDRS